jgi:hypothetical protein
MTEPVAAAPTATTTTETMVLPEPSPMPHHPWDQQQGENDLWYSRFLRFVALGPTRSVSLVATGRRNAYPIPAHWPIQAKQRSWRERAAVFDKAAKDDPTLVDTFNVLIGAFILKAPNGEAGLLHGVVYQAPTDDYEN